MSQPTGIPPGGNCRFTQYNARNYPFPHWTGSQRLGRDRAVARGILSVVRECQSFLFRILVSRKTWPKVFGV
jgi:hypothetical protein